MNSSGNKQHRWYRRILALALAAMLVAGTLPVNSFAEKVGTGENSTTSTVTTETTQTAETTEAANTSTTEATTAVGTEATTATGKNMEGTHPTSQNEPSTTTEAESAVSTDITPATAAASKTKTVVDTPLTPQEKVDAMLNDLKVYMDKTPFLQEDLIALNNGLEEVGKFCAENGINELTGEQQTLWNQLAQATMRTVDIAYAAKIEGDNRVFVTLEEALNAAQPGDTVTLLKDVQESVYYNPGFIDFNDYNDTSFINEYGVTLDLNKHTLSGTGTNYSCLTLDGGILTIKNGTISTYSQNCLIKTIGAYLILNGVTIIQSNTDSLYGALCFDSKNIDGNEYYASVLLNGGTTISAPIAMDLYSCAVAIADNPDDPFWAPIASSVDYSATVKGELLISNNATLFFNKEALFEGNLIIEPNTQSDLIARHKDITLNVPDGFEWCESNFDSDMYILGHEPVMVSGCGSYNGFYTTLYDAVSAVQEAYYNLDTNNLNTFDAIVDVRDNLNGENIYINVPMTIDLNEHTYSLTEEFSNEYPYTPVITIENEPPARSTNDNEQCTVVIKNGTILSEYASNPLIDNIGGNLTLTDVDLIQKYPDFDDYALTSNSYEVGPKSNITLKGDTSITVPKERYAMAIAESNAIIEDATITGRIFLLGAQDTDVAIASSDNELSSNTNTDEEFVTTLSLASPDADLTGASLDIASFDGVKVTAINDTLLETPTGYKWNQSKDDNLYLLDTMFNVKIDVSYPISNGDTTSSFTFTDKCKYQYLHQAIDDISTYYDRFQSENDIWNNPDISINDFNASITLLNENETVTDTALYLSYPLTLDLNGCTYEYRPSGDYEFYDAYEGIPSVIKIGAETNKEFNVTIKNGSIASSERDAILIENGYQMYLYALGINEIVSTITAEASEDYCLTLSGITLKQKDDSSVPSLTSYHRNVVLDDGTQLYAGKNSADGSNADSNGSSGSLYGLALDLRCSSAIIKNASIYGDIKISELPEYEDNKKLLFYNEAFIEGNLIVVPDHTEADICAQSDTLLTAPEGYYWEDNSSQSPAPEFPYTLKPELIATVSGCGCDPENPDAPNPYEGQYRSLAEAVNAVEDAYDEGIYTSSDTFDPLIALSGHTTGGSIYIYDSMTIDLGGYTYTFDPAKSPDYDPSYPENVKPVINISSYDQENTVHIKNGTINSPDADTTLIYCDYRGGAPVMVSALTLNISSPYLTLTDMTLVQDSNNEFPVLNSNDHSIIVEEGTSGKGTTINGNILVRGFKYNAILDFTKAVAVSGKLAIDPYDDEITVKKTTAQSDFIAPGGYTWTNSTDQDDDSNVLTLTRDASTNIEGGVVITGANDYEYTEENLTLEGAINYVSEHNIPDPVITLLKGTDESPLNYEGDTLVINVPLRIDLNGNNYTINRGCMCYEGIYIETSSPDSVIIENGGISLETVVPQKETYLIYTSSNLVLNNVTLDGSNVGHVLYWNGGHISTPGSTITGNIYACLYSAENGSLDLTGAKSVDCNLDIKYIAIGSSNDTVMKGSNHSVTIPDEYKDEYKWENDTTLVYNYGDPDDGDGSGDDTTNPDDGDESGDDSNTDTQNHVFQYTYTMNGTSYPADNEAPLYSNNLNELFASLSPNADNITITLLKDTDIYFLNLFNEMNCTLDLAGNKVSLEYSGESANVINKDITIQNGIITTDEDALYLINEGALTLKNITFEATPIPGKPDLKFYLGCYSGSTTTLLNTTFPGDILVTDGLYGNNSDNSTPTENTTLHLGLGTKGCNLYVNGNQWIITRDSGMTEPIAPGGYSWSSHGNKELLTKNKESYIVKNINGKQVADNTNYTSLAEAVQKVPEDSTIALTGSFSGKPLIIGNAPVVSDNPNDKPIIKPRNITLDLGEYDYYVYSKYETDEWGDLVPISTAVEILQGANVLINSDGGSIVSIDPSICWLIENAGTLKLNNLNLSITSEEQKGNSDYGVIYCDQGTIDMKGTTLDAGKAGKALWIHYLGAGSYEDIIKITADSDSESKTSTFIGEIYISDYVQRTHIDYDKPSYALQSTDLQLNLNETKVDGWLNVDLSNLDNANSDNDVLSKEYEDLIFHDDIITVTKDSNNALTSPTGYYWKDDTHLTKVYAPKDNATSSAIATNVPDPNGKDKGEAVYYADLQTALAHSSYVKLLNDVPSSGTGKIEINHDVILDLGGTEDNEFQDGSGIGDGLVINSGNVVIKNGSLNTTTSPSTDSNITANIVLAGGTVTLENVTLDNTTTSPTTRMRSTKAQNTTSNVNQVGVYIADVKSKVSNLTMTNSTINASSVGIMIQPGGIYNKFMNLSNSLTINEGTIINAPVGIKSSNVTNTTTDATTTETQQRPTLSLTMNGGEINASRRGIDLQQGSLNAMGGKITGSEFGIYANSIDGDIDILLNGTEVYGAGAESPAVVALSAGQTNSKNRATTQAQDTPYQTKITYYTSNKDLIIGADQNVQYLDTISGQVHPGTTQIIRNNNDDTSVRIVLVDTNGDVITDPQYTTIWYGNPTDPFVNLTLVDAASRNNTDTVNIIKTINIIWDDNDNEKGKRPTDPLEFKVQSGDGSSSSSYRVPVPTDNSNIWSYNFNPLLLMSLKNDQIILPVYNYYSPSLDMISNEVITITYKFTEKYITSTSTEEKTTVIKHYEAYERIKYNTVYVAYGVAGYAGKLTQTGQLNWPIPVLAAAGALSMAFGLFLLKRKKRNYEEQ